jgi:SAM-dependent methyltransferase
METNRRHWDEAVAVHAASDFYDLASFKAGRSALLPVEREEVGDVRGKTLLHLQCHFGMDTLSWARAGASVTGIDFSHQAIDTARGLAAELDIDARFIETNIYDLPALLSEQFDVVFTSYGALCWLPDLPQWAWIAASYLKQGGVFYVIDGHPAANMLDYEAAPDELKVHRSYFGNGEPMAWEEDGTYADLEAKFENKRTYDFNYSLADVVGSLIDAGLRIELLHEFPFCAWQAVKGMLKGDDGYYRLPESSPSIPFLFSIRATKPA